jgi:hypothetical protein
MVSERRFARTAHLGGQAVYSRTRTVVGLMAAGLAVNAFMAPASANTRPFEDIHADAPPYIDILSVTVDNATMRADQVRVTVRQRLLSSAKPSEILLYIDTKLSHPGPEFRYAALHESEFGFQRMRSWNKEGAWISTCRDKIRVRLRAHWDSIVFFIPRSCLDYSRKVRVAVRTAYGYPYKEQDWAPRVGTFYPWVSR